MNDQSEPTIFMILNSEAAVDDELRQLVADLRVGGYNVDVRVSWEKGHTAKFSDEAIEAEVDAVVGCGGDGTLHDIVNTVMTGKERPMVAGLPYGTGNDFLRGLGIDLTCAPQEFGVWLETAPTAIDVGRCGERYFLNMATAGVGAEVTAQVSRDFKDVAGSFAYFVSGIPAAFDLPVQQTKIRAPDFDWQGKMAFLFVGNGQYSGGGWRLCPAARIDDGLLDVVIVPEMPLREMARCGRDMVKAESTGDFGPLIYRQVSKLDVEFDDDVPLNLDGEPVEGREFTFSAVEKAIRFLVP